MIKGIFVLSIYILLSLITYYIIKKQYRVSVNQTNCLSFKPKISFKYMLVISLLFGIFNLIITIMSNGNYGGDRLNYYIEYQGIRSTTSPLLDLLFHFFNILGFKIEYFFVFTTFLCVLITLFAYRISKRMNPSFVLLLLCSEWIIFTLAALKQAYACAFASLFFVFSFENKKKTGVVFGIITALLASFFHISGLILFPLLFIIRKRLKSSDVIIITLLSIILFIFFDEIMLMMARIMSNFLPSYASKIEQYFIEGNDVSDRSIFSFIKYLPIYYIAILGFAYRKKYSNSISDYNNYLIVSMIAALLVGYSYFSYWFSRFNAIFYFPLFVFYTMLNSKIKDNNIKIVNGVFVYLFSAFILARLIILTYVNFGSF